MLVFSELLKKYINENKISVKKLASELHMDRTLIQKYMSGNRIPKNYLEVELIGHGLMLLPQQKEELLEAYYRKLYGDRNYEGYITIKKALEGARDFRIETSDYQEMTIDDEKSQDGNLTSGMFYGKLAVEHAFIQMVRGVYRRKGGDKVEVKMMIQPEQENLLRAILHVINQKNIVVEHIVCLDRDRNNNNNIVLFFSILTLAMGAKEYSIRYYYDNIASHINKMSLLPNLVMVDGHVFLCNHSMDQCLILQEGETATFFLKQYESIRKETMKMNVNRRTILRFAESMEAMQAEGSYIGIGYYPCFFMTFDRRLMGEYFVFESTEKETLIACLESVHSLLGRAEQYRDYFSEDAIRKFMETGEVLLYPIGTCKKVKKRDRLLMLERLVQLIRAGQYRACMVDGKKISIDSEIAFVANEDGYVCFWCRNHERDTSLAVKENSICDGLYGFEKFIRENAWVYGEDETLERLEKMVEDYS